MGRSSQASFSKREKEKKKIQKKKDKAKRKADRQANSIDNPGLDDMIAYVDENGNITSTPPEGSPTAKDK